MITFRISIICILLLIGSIAYAAKDTDGDGIDDMEETVVYRTDIHRKDTDSDGLSDGLEVEEYFTDPLLTDTDGDGLSDGDEVNNRHTNPLVVDTDGDGSTDAEEIANMTDLNDAGDYFRVLGFALAAGFDPLTNPMVSITFSSFPGLAYEAETDNALGTFEPVPGSLLVTLAVSLISMPKPT